MNWYMNGKPFLSRRSVIKYLISAYAGLLLPVKLVYGIKPEKHRSNRFDKIDIQPPLPLVGPGAPKLQVVGYGHAGLKVTRRFKRCCPHWIETVHLAQSNGFVDFSDNNKLNNAHMTFVVLDLEELGESDRNHLRAILNTIKNKSTLSFVVVNWPGEPYPDAVKDNSYLNQIEPLTDMVVIAQRNHIVSASGQTHRLSISKARSLAMAIKAITSKLIHTGFVGLDFADYVDLFKNAGIGLAMTGISEGKNRSRDAVDSVFYQVNGVNRNDFNINCRAMYANIHSSEDITIKEIMVISKYLSQKIPSSAELVFGQVVNDKMGSAIRVDCVPVGVPYWQ